MVDVVERFESVTLYSRAVQYINITEIIIACNFKHKVDSKTEVSVTSCILHILKVNLPLLLMSYALHLGSTSLPSGPA